MRRNGDSKGPRLVLVDMVNEARPNPSFWVPVDGCEINILGEGTSKSI